MKNFRNVLWGFVLIFVGIVLGLNALGIADINLFFNGWWTLFIIVPSFINLFKEENKIGNLIFLSFGTLLLLSCQGIIDFDIMWKLFVPAVLVVLGLSFIFKNTLYNKTIKKVEELNKNRKDSKEYNGIFSSQKLDFNEEEFNGGDMSAIFGGIECDLRDAVIKEDIVINVSAIFGGIDIFVPANVNVKVNSTSVFGGVENKKRKVTDKEKTIYINATCLFGGVEIR